MLTQITLPVFFPSCLDHNVNRIRYSNDNNGKRRCFKMRRFSVFNAENKLQRFKMQLLFSSAVFVSQIIQSFYPLTYDMLIDKSSKLKQVSFMKPSRIKFYLYFNKHPAITESSQCQPLKDLFRLNKP